MMVVSPRAAALRVLAARAEHQSTPVSSSLALAEYQLEAVARAREIIRLRGGVIIADGVGLGKTFIAAALIEPRVGKRERVVVVIPAALRRSWRQSLGPLLDEPGASIQFVTHGQLSRGAVFETSSLVVVDEAHAFRNPHTRRYRALRLACRHSRVVLLTATPVNNSLSDLYFQLRLFAADDAFRDLGFGDLRVLLRPRELDADALQRLRAAVVIRRSRAEIRARFDQIVLPDGRSLRFPTDVRLETITHPPLIDSAELKRFLEHITFAAHGSDAACALLGLSLLKRFQSSRAAAIVSVRRLIQFHRSFLDALARGEWLRPRALRAHADEQLVLTELIAEPLSPGSLAASTREHVRRDLESLEQLERRLSQSVDDKLPQLVRLLSARAPPARTAVFTEFADTAVDLWRHLSGRCQVGLITGRTAFLGQSQAGRWEVIRRFAPHANEAPVPPVHEAVHVLIATDVLAEGLNLQDADAVVSYDLPWNPVRLIQRAGRVCRIGSGFEAVTVYNFMPDRDFDAFLGLVRRLRAKLFGLRAAVGHDAPVLEADELDERFMQDLRAGRANAVLDDSAPSAYRLQDTVDLSEAGPRGCIAMMSPAPRRVLVVFQAGPVTRELIVDAGGVRDDVAEAERILALTLSQSLPLGRLEDVAAAISAAREHLRREALSTQNAPLTRQLSRAVQSAVNRLRFLATSPALIALADRAIAEAAGFVGEPARALARLRAARSPKDLEMALESIVHECRAPLPQSTDWQLIAAIGAD